MDTDLNVDVKAGERRNLSIAFSVIYDRTARSESVGSLQSVRLTSIFADMRARRDDSRIAAKYEPEGGRDMTVSGQALNESEVNA